MRHTRNATILLAAATVLLSGCARSVAIESETGPRYTLEVSNPMSHAMIVSYETGDTSRLLGTVPAGGTERFIVVDPASPTVTVVATDENRTHTVRERVTLRTDATASVTLTP